MIKKIEKLRKHTQEISDIMFNAQSSFKIVDYLQISREPLERETINQNTFLRYSREIYWRIYIIELSKLFSNRSNDYFNLNLFIQKFKKGMEFEIIEIDKYSIQIWEQNLLLEKPKIENLLLQRDKLYSHTDKNRDHVKNELTLSNAKELLQIVQRIVSEIYIAVFGEVIHFDLINEPLDDLKKIVVLLIDQKKEFLSFYNQHCIEHGIDPKEMGL